MKRKHGVLFGFAVFLTAAILVFTGCPADGGGDGGSSDPSDPQTAVYTSTDAGGNTYTMTVTETVPPAASYNRAYTAKAEDVYELLIAYANGSPSKKSKGKVLSVQDGGVVVLQPTVNVNVTFNVTINVTTGAMTNITAPNGIACEDNTTAAVPSEGLTLNPAAPLYFNALAANGSQTEATTQLSLTLASTAAGTSGVETVGLEASHITVTPNTALTKGALSFSGGKWLLAVSGVGSTQTVTVSIAGLDGYALVPASRTATVFDGKSSVISDPEITGSITQDSILGEAGQQKTYVYNGMGQFEITNNATLTVLPGTTIRFTKSGAGIAVQDGSTIKLNGTAVLLDAEGAPVLGADNEPLSGHVRLIGGTAKGSWGGVTIRSKTDNSFDYVDILNGGSGTAAYSCVVHVYPGSLSMTNSLIDGSASNGITTEGDGVLTAFSQNTVSNCGKAPVYAYSSLRSLRNIAGDNVFTGNTNGYIHVRDAGSASADMTIRKLSIPWQLYNRFNVNESAKLTVEPGTIIRFDSGAGITVASTAAVVMDGTEDQHIVLSGITTNAGAWGNVDIRSKRNENSLSYVDILNGGGGTAAWSSALYLYGGAADVNNCTIVNSGSNGLTTESDGYLRTFAGNAVNKSGKTPIYTYSTIYSLRNIGSGNTFSENANNYVHINTNTSITGNMSLKKLDIPYFLQAGLSISAGNGINPTLTIEPGTRIWINGQQGINVDNNSRLVAVGTADEHIEFRGSTDQAGWWDGITIRSQGQGTRFDYCDISGGGRAAGYYSNNCLFIWAGAWVDIRNTAFNKSNFYYVGFDDDNASTGYHIYSANVTFGEKGSTDLLANVWYEGSANPTAAALPANNFTPAVD